MSDFDRNQRVPGYQNNRAPGARGWTSGSWLAGIIIAILVIIAVGYAFSDRWYTNTGVTEHRAAATDSTTAPAPAASPAPAATPAGTTK
jgi:hypothetical protein